jgi:hypothetical protein
MLNNKIKTILKRVNFIFMNRHQDLSIAHDFLVQVAQEDNAKS